MFKFAIDRVPPSVNHYWIQTKNRRFISKEGKEFKKELNLIAKSKIKTPLKGKVGLNITVILPNKRRRDVDNFLKPILDGLNNAAYVDDYQVYKLSIKKTVSRNKEAKTIIEVYEVGERA